MNHASFEEAGALAQDELHMWREAKYAPRISRWKDVPERLGSCVVRKLAGIIKTKRVGGVKIRLVIDFRRSGMNRVVKAKEHVVLPRLVDVLTDGM